MLIGSTITITNPLQTRLPRVKAHVLEQLQDGRYHLVLPHGDYAYITPDQIEFTQG